MVANVLPRTRGGLGWEAFTTKSVLHSFVSKDNKRTEASYEVASVIARHGKPFTDGEYIKDALLRVSETLFSDLKNKDEIVRRVKEVPLSDSTIRSRIMDMADDEC